MRMTNFQVGVMKDSLCQAFAVQDSELTKFFHMLIPLPLDPLWDPTFGHLSLGLETSQQNCI